MDDDSGDSEEDEGEQDWLRQGWYSVTGLFSCDYNNNFLLDILQMFSKVKKWKK